MTKLRDYDEPLDVEAMVRAAGQYVRASEDLRPSVLEAARLNCSEQRVQRCIRHVAVFVILLSLFTAVDRHVLDDQRSRSSGLLGAACFDEIYSSTAAATARSGDGDWRMVDAFTELRRHQAQVLRFAM